MMRGLLNKIAEHKRIHRYLTISQAAWNRRITPSHASLLYHMNSSWISSIYLIRHFSCIHLLPYNTSLHRATMEDDNDRSEYTMAVNPVGNIYMDMSGRNSHTTVQYLTPLSHTESQSTNHYQMIPFVGNREITLRTTTLESVPTALPERRQEVPVVYSTVGKKRVKKLGKYTNIFKSISLIFHVVALLLYSLVIGNSKIERRFFKFTLTVFIVARQYFFNRSRFEY